MSIKKEQPKMICSQTKLNDAEKNINKVPKFLPMMRDSEVKKIIRHINYPDLLHINLGNFQVSLTY